MTTAAQENGYVECGECGAPIEQHNKNGSTLPDSTCKEKWTKKEIVRVRIREGLPGRWNL